MKIYNHVLLTLCGLLSSLSANEADATNRPHLNFPVPSQFGMQPWDAIESDMARHVISSDCPISITYLDESCQVGFGLERQEGGGWMCLIRVAEARLYHDNFIRGSIKARLEEVRNAVVFEAEVAMPEEIGKEIQKTLDRVLDQTQYPKGDETLNDAVNTSSMFVYSARDKGGRFYTLVDRGVAGHIQDLTILCAEGIGGELSIESFRQLLIAIHSALDKQAQILVVGPFESRPVSAADMRREVYSAAKIKRVPR